MGYVLAMGPCLRCGRVFSFNPHRVPSQRLFSDERRPICEACFNALQRLRIEKGLEPWPPPLPGAYEAMDEEEL